MLKQVVFVLSLVVDVNNPRVYGFELIRITDRSTEMLDIMKEDRGFKRLKVDYFLNQNFIKRWNTKN